MSPIADLDGDRIHDVLIGGTAGVSAKLLLARPDGTFAEQPNPAWAADAAAADATPLVFDAMATGATMCCSPRVA